MNTKDNKHIIKNFRRKNPKEFWNKFKTKSKRIYQLDHKNFVFQYTKDNRHIIKNLRRKNPKEFWNKFKTKSDSNPPKSDGCISECPRYQLSQ